MLDLKKMRDKRAGKRNIPHLYMYCFFCFFSFFFEEGCVLPQALGKISQSRHVFLNLIRDCDW